MVYNIETVRKVCVGGDGEAVVLIIGRNFIPVRQQ